MCGFFSLILHTSKLKNIIIFYLLSLLGFLTIPSTFLHNYLIVLMLFFFFPCKSGKIKWLVVVVAVLIHATGKIEQANSPPRLQLVWFLDAVLRTWYYEVILPAWIFVD